MIHLASKLPVMKSEKFIRLLIKKFGFRIVRQRASHVTLVTFIQGRELKITVPLHRGREVAKGIVNDIIKSLANMLGESREKIIERLLDP